MSERLTSARAGNAVTEVQLIMRMRSISLCRIWEARVVSRATSMNFRPDWIATIEVAMPRARTNVAMVTSRIVKPPRRRLRGKAAAFRPVG
jgi:hypothetical protein